MHLVLLSILTLAGIAGLLWQRGPLRATTLTVPWWWMVASLLAVGITPLFLAPWTLPGEAERSIRFAAAAGTLCPLVGLLGARRPHAGAWHFIVLSLWLVLALPAAEALLGRGGGLEVRGARSLFMLGLVVLGGLNHLPTRFALPAWLLAAGQSLLLADVLPLPGLDSLPAAPRYSAGVGLQVASIVTHGMLLRKSPAAGTWNRLWLEFRDLYGVLWSLRFMERMNAAALRNQWPLQFTWQGLRTPGGEPLDDVPSAAVQQSLWNLLRRFVSQPWIAARLELPEWKPQADGPAE